MQNIKSTITIFLSIIVSTSIFGQSENNYNINFDNPGSFEDRIIIDTINNKDNIWQIGNPEKTIFSSAHSAPNAIVTDRLNPYPENDTSFFDIVHIRPSDLGGNEVLQLNFWYRIDTESSSDYGMVEASIDGGNLWINLLTDDDKYGLYWLDPKPILSGQSNGWKHFGLELNNLTYSLGYSDTILYRFTFISDNHASDNDGWILDDFNLQDWWESINEDFIDHVNIFPNPSNGQFNIEFHNSVNLENIVDVYNLQGGRIMSSTLDSGILNLNLPPGIYLLRFSKNNRYVYKKVVIE